MFFVAMDLPKTAEAIIEVGVCQLMMNNLNNALKTFERAMNMNEEIKYIPGMCETRMHLAAVMQRYSNTDNRVSMRYSYCLILIEYLYRDG